MGNKKSLEDSILQTAELEKPKEVDQTPESILSDSEEKDFQEELNLEKKYGDQNLRTFLESGASAASFGISDQILTKLGGEEAKQALRERRQRNPEADLAGEIAGVVAPALLSGGTSAAAKGAAAGVKTAAKAGSFIEKVSAKQLAKIIDQTGRKEIAKSIITKSIPKSAGSAVEGAFYGTGELISENALGNAEFNAENLIASAGTGALLGGAAGGVLGSVEGLVPVIKNNKIVDYVAKKINTNVDRRVAGAKYAGMTSPQMTNLRSTTWGEQIYNNIPNYLTENLNLKAWENKATHFKRSNIELKRLGDEIAETALEIDKLAQGKGILPTKAKIATTVQNNLAELRDQFLKNPDEAAKKSLKKLDNRIASWDEWLNDTSPIKATEIKELKTNLQQATKWNKSIDQIPLDGKMDREVAEAVRREFLDLADNVSTLDADLGSKLRKLNLDYGTGLVVTKNLKKTLDKEATSEILKFKDLLVADVLTEVVGGVGIATATVAAKKFLESNLRRKLTLLTNVESANLKINKKISKGIKNFFKASKKAAIPTSTKALLNTTLALPNSDGGYKKKPKNKKEAFKQISDNLREYQQNPEKLINHLGTNALSLTNAAPNTALAMNSTLTSALAFLTSKLPTDASQGSLLFNRKFEPSDVEIAKFERYLEAVESPMSVLDDLESGTATKEGIEAIKTVYPDIYQRIQEQAVEQISQNPELSYQKRLQLGTLLDIPADSSLIPENVTALQQTFADLEQQQTAAAKEPQGAVPTTQGGLSNISKSEDTMPSSQQTAERK